MLNVATYTWVERFEAKANNTYEMFAPKRMLTNGESIWEDLDNTAGKKRLGCFFHPGLIVSYVISTGWGAQAPMTGSDSWLQYHACNKLSQCCSSGSLYEMGLGAHQRFQAFITNQATSNTQLSS